MNASLRALVRKRANWRCEYCRLHEDDDDFLAFHVEHVIAKQHGGKVTIQVLNINEPARVMLRENLLFEGRFPPDEG